jgi:hypothetical protein
MAAVHASVPVAELDRGCALRVLEGRASYGAGFDELVSLLADACAAPSPLELRGEEEALAAFRAAHSSRSRLQVVSVPAESATRTRGRGRRRPPARQVPARRVAPQVTATPVIGSVLAVAASAAVIVLAYTASVGLPRISDSGGRSVVSGPVERQVPGAHPGTTHAATTAPGADTAVGQPGPGGSVQTPAGGAQAGAGGGASAGLPTQDDPRVAGMVAEDGGSASSSASPEEPERSSSPSGQSQGQEQSLDPVGAGAPGVSEGGATPPANAPVQAPAPARPAQGPSQVVPRGPANVPHDTRSGPSSARTDDARAPADDHPSSGGEQGKAPVQGAADETGASARVTVGTGGAPLFAGQALPALLRAECGRWVGRGGNAGGATLLPGVALLTAGSRDPALVDRLCADLLAVTP